MDQGGAAPSPRSPRLDGGKSSRICHYHAALLGNSPSSGSHRHGLFARTFGRSAVVRTLFGTLRLGRRTRRTRDCVCRMSPQRRVGRCHCRSQYFVRIQLFPSCYSGTRSSRCQSNHWTPGSFYHCSSVGTLRFGRVIEKCNGHQYGTYGAWRQSSRFASYHLYIH